MMTDDNITIRTAEPRDIKTIVEFNRAMARETEGKDLDERRLRAGVEEIFKLPPLGFYLVAERDSDVVGQMLITYEWSDWRNGVFWWIQSVYVRKDMRRKGVYRTLHQYVMNRARNTPGVCGARLYVERNNTVAQAVYREMGMAKADYLMFEDDFVL